MKKLLFLSGICLATLFNIPLHAASAAQQAYIDQIAAAQELLDLAELDLLILDDRNFFISMMQTENINREEQTASALTREQRIALSTIAQALLDMNQEETILLSAEDNDIIRTYINPPKAPAIIAPVKQPTIGPKEGSHEWHLAMLREELRTRLHSLGAAARDVTIEAYEKLLKEKDAALKAIQKKITMASSKDKKRVEAQNASEKSALNAFVQELRTKLTDLKTKTGQEIIQKRMQEKIARPVAGAASLERKITTPLKRALDQYKVLEDQINNLPQNDDTLRTLKQYALLVAKKDEVVANSPELQEYLAKQSVKILETLTGQVEFLRNKTKNVQYVRENLLAMIDRFNPDFLDYPKDGKEEPINDMLEITMRHLQGSNITTSAVIDQLHKIQDLTPELELLRLIWIVFLETGSEQHPVTAQEASTFFSILKQRIFPQEKINLIKELAATTSEPVQAVYQQPKVVPNKLEQLQKATTDISTMVNTADLSKLTLAQRLPLVEQIGNTLSNLHTELEQEPKTDIIASNALLDHIQNHIIIYKTGTDTINVPTSIANLNSLKKLTPIMNIARDLFITFLRIAQNPSRYQIEQMIQALKVRYTVTPR